MLESQNLPVVTRFPMPTIDPLTSLFEPDALCRPSVGISASVGRISEDAVDSCVDWELPHNVASLQAIGDLWQGNALPTQPTMNLTYALQLSELLEHQFDRLLYSSIRILFDAVFVCSLAVAHGDPAK